MDPSPTNTKCGIGLLCFFLAGFFLPGCSQPSAPGTNQIAQAQSGNPAPPPSAGVQGANPAPQLVQPPSGLATTGQFEQPPIANISELLSPDMQSGPGFHVEQQVPTNGAMGQYTIAEGSQL